MWNVGTPCNNTIIMCEKCLSHLVVVVVVVVVVVAAAAAAVVVVVLGQQKAATGRAFSSIHVPTSSSMIEALSVFSCFGKMSFSRFGQNWHLNLEA
jgi:hypothetical protein